MSKTMTICDHFTKHIPNHQKLICTYKVDIQNHHFYINLYLCIVPITSTSQIFVYILVGKVKKASFAYNMQK